ncbi:E3 ubiquitin-protein ligase TRIM35 isoform X1 [Labeo rohita]|uniref:E3 ubiquitin-protein ligase TRIM35 isoform X1 n=1 Tax=Labeo rohita TaxID=84645 RepID=UPI0021E3193F|nr:E3 ubiquitin-protein ligase TRIM35 isoform X1 [Labeo rohita]
MASFSDELLSCPICLDVFADPVILQCGHSGCKACVEQYWRVEGEKVCPVCRETSPTNNPPLNLTLQNLCQVFLDHRRRLEELCEVHQVKRTLVCCDDEKLLCEICRQSEEHRNHTYRPIQEAAEERKGVLRIQLDLLTRRRKMMEDVRTHCDCMTDHIKKQATLVEQTSKGHFKNLHQLLNKEEQAMLDELNQETEQKADCFEEKTLKINEDITSLSNTIEHLEKELENGDIRIIRNFKETLKRAQVQSQAPEITSRDIIDSAKYLGNFKLNVWKKMRKRFSYSPVVLDFNTACHQLSACIDMISVFNHEDNMEKYRPDWLPLNRERFVDCPCVLGYVGYSTGTHTWDVDVEENMSWMVGVAIESVQRKGTNGLPSGVWCIGYDREILSVTDPLESRVPLHGFAKPTVVRVNLDLSAGRLSFSDPLGEMVYHTFTHNFTEKVYPFFYNECSYSITILPAVESEEK